MIAILGILARMRVVTVSVIAIAFAAVIYAEVGQLLINRAQTQSGPFTGIANQIDSVVPLVLVLLLLTILIWLVVSSVREERSVQRRVRR